MKYKYLKILTNTNINIYLQNTWLQEFYCYCEFVFVRRGIDAIACALKHICYICASKIMREDDIIGCYLGPHPDNAFLPLAIYLSCTGQLPRLVLGVPALRVYQSTVLQKQLATPTVSTL